MSGKQLQGLIQMANQIAENIRYGSSSDDEAAEQVAAHMRKFWARPMKAQIAEYLREDGAGLSSVARSAVEHL